MATTYYVSTTGNDTTGNGSVNLPYATINKALSISPSPNTISVAPGTYTPVSTGKITISIPVTIIGSGPGVILDFRNIPSYNSFIQVTSSNVSIINMSIITSVAKTTVHCIMVGGSTTGNTLSNIILDGVIMSTLKSTTASYCVCLQSSPSVILGSNKFSNITIQNCELTNATNGLKINFWCCMVALAKKNKLSRFE